MSGEHIGAEPTLPYLSPELQGEKLLVGANFASAGVGVLNDTGIQFVRKRVSSYFVLSLIDNYRFRISLTYLELLVGTFSTSFSFFSIFHDNE